MRGFVSILVAGIALVLARPAIGDESVESRQRRAKAFWEQGAAKYDAGDFRAAVELFQQAYDIWAYPEILFNLCQSWRQLKDYERAVFMCKSYLRNKPDAANRDDVEDLVLEMEQIHEAQRVNAERPPEGVARPGNALRPSDTPPPARRAWYADRWAWTITLSGAVVGGVGVGLLVSASGLESEAASARSEIERDARLDDAASRKTLGTTVCVVGALLVATGVTLLAWNPSGDRVDRIAVGPGWMSIAGRF